MKTRLLKTALCASTLFAAALLAAPVYADNLTGVTLTANSPVFTEGDTGELVLTVTNNSSVSIFLLGDSVGIAPPTAGDTSDGVVSHPFDRSMSTCGFSPFSLGKGSSCTLVLDLATENGASETDADSGVSLGSAFVVYNTATGAGYTANAPTFTVTVNDVSVSTTPEPSSLLLLGSGLLGMLGLGRKRLV